MAAAAPAATAVEFSPSSTRCYWSELANPFGQSYVIVRAQSSSSISAISGLISQVGGTLGRQLPILTARAARLPNLTVLLLAANPLVQRIALDRLMFGFTERTGLTVKATEVRQQLGYDGSGIGVAVIDSGVTPWHNDLADVSAPSTQRVDRFVDFVAGQTTAYDDYGHGTHVAGIIAGNGADSNGARTGIAPKSRLVVLKVLDGAGRGRISDVIAAIDYAVAHKTELNIRIINLSVGAGVYESYNTDLLTLAAKRAVEEGIVVVVAAGNHGRNAQGVVQHGAISAPGNAPWVITVGASSHMGTNTRADDTIAAFSSRGPTAYDHAAKPDLVAPGVGIYSLSSPNSTMYNSWSQYLLPWCRGRAVHAVSQLERDEPGRTGRGRHGGADAAGQSVADAERGQSDPAIHRGGVPRQFLSGAGRRFSQRARRGRPRPGLQHGARRAGAVPPEWSRQIIWGNHRIQGGDLTSTANAWATNVAWGAATDVQRGSTSRGVSPVRAPSAASAEADGAIGARAVRRQRATPSSGAPRSR